MSKSFVIRKQNRNLQQGPIIGLNKEPVEFSTVGDNTIVAAIPTRKIVIHSLVIVIEGATTIQFFSGPSASNNPKSGHMIFMNNAAMVLDETNVDLEMDAGEAFVITLTDAVTVGGWLQYSIL